MRLIDGDLLKLNIIEEGQRSKRYKLGEFWELNLNEIWKVIDEQPIIEEHKTGRWIYDDEAYPGGNPYGHYDCDQCGESVPHKTNFCPNCGCMMEVKHG